jgi:hypothetical protein
MPRRSPSPTPSFFTSGPASDDGLASAPYRDDASRGSSALESAPLYDDDDVGARSSLTAGSRTASDLSELSDVMTDPLDDFLERYTFDPVPAETVAKLKKR